MDCLEALQEMYEASDNRLAKSSKPQAAAHLKECPNCQKLLKIDKGAREVVKKVAAVKVPPGLETRISQRINEIDRLSWKEKLSWFLPGRPWGWLGSAGVMIATLLVTGYWTLTHDTSFVNWVFEEQTEYLSGGFKLDIVSTDPVEVDNWFEQKVGFRVGADKFQRAGLELVGGMKLDFAKEKAALIYFKRGEAWVGLYAVPNEKIKLENLTERKVVEKTFWVGSQDNLSLVAWREPGKKLTCSLVGELPAEELVQIIGAI